MNQDLNPTDVADWMREQARRFTEMAEQIEATFSLNGRPAVPSKRVESMKSEKERIRALLGDRKARRIATIAKELSIPDFEVSGLVQNSNEFERNQRGWITLASSEGGDDA